MEILFLGTSCTQPTKERNHPGVLLIYKGEYILFDCGEGIQRQMKVAGVKASKISKLLISHWHGDHVLGIPGLIQTMGVTENTNKLLIFGPSGSEEHMKYMLKAFESRGSVEFLTEDVENGIIFENDDYYIESHKLNHNPTSVGFKFVEKDKRKINVRKIEKLGIPEGPILGKLQKGKDVIFKGKKIKCDEVTDVVKGRSIAYIGDTGMCNGCIDLAKDVDVLISESTFLDKDKDKAEERLHLTAKEAGLIANGGNVKKLILTHFSLRYKDVNELCDEAKNYFDNTLCAYDFMRVKL